MSESDRPASLTLSSHNVVLNRNLSESERRASLALSSHNVQFNRSMSESERPPSRASTVSSIESTTPAEAVAKENRQSIDEKQIDPWLVSFPPNDPENPMVWFPCQPVFTAFSVFNNPPSFAELVPEETLVHHNHCRPPSFEFVRASHCWSLLPLTRAASRTFSSSAPSNLVPAMMEYFGFGKEVGALTVSLFISGYCLGPLLWGPLSEDVSFSKSFTVDIYSLLS